MKPVTELPKTDRDPSCVLIDLDLIDDGPNMRTDLLTLTEENEELIQSITAQGGVIQPIGVFPVGDRYQLIHGARRTFCSRRAGFKRIRALIHVPPQDLAELLILQTHENGHRVDVEPVQFGESLKKIKEIRGWTGEQVAKEVCFNTSKVSRLLQLADQPDAIKTLVQSGKVGVSTALELGKYTGEELHTLIPQVCSGAITRDQLIRLRKSHRKPRTKTVAKNRRVTVALEAGRSLTACGVGISLETLIAMLETVLAKARRARQAGVEIAAFVAMSKDQSRATASC